VLDDNVEKDLVSFGALWYVMPFYRAGPMRRPRKEDGLGEFAEPYQGNVERVLSIARDIAETVSWMHSGSPQILHRDIHTGNIFFDALGGRPTLGDFGLAASRQLPSGTRVEEGFGPWRWRPPEIRPGSEHKQHPRSDVYMIGGVIYEALSGGRYIEDTQDILGGFVHEKSEFNLQSMCTDPRVALVTQILRRCFCRDPDARFTAGELASNLAAILDWREGQQRPNLGERRDRIRAAEEAVR
jgi:serine/threonine protein kinase